MGMIIPNKSGIIPCVIPRKFGFATSVHRQMGVICYTSVTTETNIYHTDLIFAPIESSQRVGLIGTKIMSVRLVSDLVVTKVCG